MYLIFDYDFSYIWVLMRTSNNNLGIMHTLIKHNLLIY